MGKILKNLLVLIIYLFCITSNSQIKTISLDTSAVKTSENYHDIAIGYYNNTERKYTLTNYFDEENDDIKNMKIFHIDTLKISDYENIKLHYKPRINKDTTLVTWTDKSFFINSIELKADKKDYSEFNYYLGYLEYLQLFAVEYVNGHNEYGILSLYDRNSNKYIYIESPSDDNLSFPDISAENSVLSTYVNCQYNNYSFISLFKIKKKNNLYTLHDLLGIELPNSKIEDLIWIKDNQFIIKVIELNENGTQKIYTHILKITL